LLLFSKLPFFKICHNVLTLSLMGKTHSQAVFSPSPGYFQFFIL
jgi:hypothetical protein